MLLPRVRETPAGKYTTDLCCKWYRSLWIYFSAKVSSSPEVGSPIAQSRNSDGQRLCCLKDKKRLNHNKFQVETKELFTHKSGEGNRRTSAALKVPVSPVASSRGLEPPGLFLVLAGDQGRRVLVREVTKNPMVTYKSPPPVERRTSVWYSGEIEAACLAPQGPSDHEKGNDLVC